MFNDLKTFVLLWSTQALSQLGSSMTSFALSIWIYEKTGSALQSAGLLISNYLPYVVVSIFAGALSDKWNKKKTMLICDSIAGVCTIIVLFLISKDLLQPWHMYVINAINGLMNTFQQPASEVAMALITPKEYYSKASGMKSFSRSLISIFCPILATSIYSLFGITTVCVIDIITFLVAFIVLAFFIVIPRYINESKEENIFVLIKEGYKYLKTNKLILNIILFLSGINLCASSYDSIVVPLVLSKTGSETILGYVTSSAGVAMLFGSMLVTFIKQPNDKAKTIYYALFFSMLFDNFFIALTDSPIIWCIGQFLGWCLIPVFNAAYDVLFNTTIPVEIRGRVYSYRNSLQFFTIPIGYFLGGALVDLFEPFMAKQNNNILTKLFGAGMGSGAALVMFFMGVVGILICLIYRNKLLYNNRIH